MCNTGTRQCGQRRVHERMHRAPVCAHGCSPLSAPSFAPSSPLARFPSRPSGAHIPSVLPSPSAFLPPLHGPLSSFSSVYLSHPPVRSCISDSLSLSLCFSLFLHPYLPIYLLPALTLHRFLILFLVRSPSIFLSLSLPPPTSPFHTQRRARAHVRSFSHG